MRIMWFLIALLMWGGTAHAQTPAFAQDIDDLPIMAEDRLVHWPLGRRPDGHAGLCELGL